jgi:steroid 5-alpha reductase family enzyme
LKQLFTFAVPDLISGNDAHFEHLTGLLIAIMIFSALACFIISEITRNYSQVDKLWSLMPIIYSLVTLIAFPSPRLLIMFTMITLWGLRLSFNFYRKGGYNIVPWKGEEDYRWKIMRQHWRLKGRLRFGIFNLFFISFYQHFLILLFCTPLLMAAKYSNYRLTWIDIVAASLMFLFLLIETIADNQLFRFRKLKSDQKGSETRYTKSLKKGFLCEGLWGFARHPNFASEQGIWISFYFFGVAASGEWINWTLVGPILLVLLFLGSTELTERISSEKYPDYAAYKNEVPKFFPDIFRSRVK